MALNKEANDYLYGLCQEFAKLHQLVRAEVSEVSIPNLSAAYLPLSDCTCDKLIRRSPSYVRRHEIVESHGQSTLQVRHSKRSDHHLGQILRAVKVARHDDKESLQIYLT
jgi:hypothetical protein